jgi:hypothetical protein
VTLDRPAPSVATATAASRSGRGVALDVWPGLSFANARQSFVERDSAERASKTSDERSAAFSRKHCEERRHLVGGQRADLGLRFVAVSVVTSAHSFLGVLRAAGDHRVVGGVAPSGGYLGGATMHLLLDIAFNGELIPTNIVAFYSFAYRAPHGFTGAALYGRYGRAVPVKFWSTFFKGASPG